MVKTLATTRPTLKFIDNYYLDLKFYSSSFLMWYSMKVLRKRQLLTPNTTQRCRNNPIFISSGPLYHKKRKKSESSLGRAIKIWYQQPNFFSSNPKFITEIYSTEFVPQCKNFSMSLHFQLMRQIRDEWDLYCLFYHWLMEKDISPKIHFRLWNFLKLLSTNHSKSTFTHFW